MVRGEEEGGAEGRARFAVRGERKEAGGVCAFRTTAPIVIVEEITLVPSVVLPTICCVELDAPLPSSLLLPVVCRTTA